VLIEAEAECLSLASPRDRKTIHFNLSQSTGHLGIQPALA